MLIIRGTKAKEKKFKKEKGSSVIWSQQIQTGFSKMNR